jgi:predicted nucleotidyltransferase
VSYRVDRRHPLAEAVRLLFAAEATRATGALDVIRKAAARLEPAPRAVWLIGSVARDEDQPGSDLDLVVVASGRRARDHADELRDAVGAAPEAWGLDVSVLSLSVRELRTMIREQPSFWRSLERDAVTLVGEAPEALAR